MGLQMSAHGKQAKNPVRRAAMRTEEVSVPMRQKPRVCHSTGQGVAGNGESEGPRGKRPGLSESEQTTSAVREGRPARISGKPFVANDGGVGDAGMVILGSHGDPGKPSVHPRRRQESVCKWWGEWGALGGTLPPTLSLFHRRSWTLASLRPRVAPVEWLHVPVPVPRPRVPKDYGAVGRARALARLTLFQTAVTHETVNGVAKLSAIWIASTRSKVPARIRSY